MSRGNVRESKRATMRRERCNEIPERDQRAKGKSHLNTQRNPEARRVGRPTTTSRRESNQIYPKEMQTARQVHTRDINTCARCGMREITGRGPAWARQLRPGEVVVRYREAQDTRHRGQESSPRRERERKGNTAVTGD